MTKGFALAVSAHMREKLCFVIFLSTDLDAVDVFFLSGSLLETTSSGL